MNTIRHQAERKRSEGYDDFTPLPHDLPCFPDQSIQARPADDFAGRREDEDPKDACATEAAKDIAVPFRPRVIERDVCAIDSGCPEPGVKKARE